MTDASTPIHDDEQIAQIAASFVEHRIHFICIGMGFGDEEEDDDDDGAVPSSFSSIRTTSNNREEKILRFFAKSANGAVFDGNSAIEMMREFTKKPVLMRPYFSGPLQITSSLLVPVKVFMKCSEQKLPSLQKESIAGNETKKVIMDRIYRNKFRAEQDDEEVEEEERVKSYRYGKERIPFNDTDDLRLTYKSGDKHFMAMCTVDAAKVRRHHFMAAPVVVFADPNSEGAQYALSALIHGLHEKKKVMLCRFVPRKNSAPKLVVLAPRIKSSRELLIGNELPFESDLRKFPFASLDVKRSYIPSRHQLAACKQLISRLNLMTAMVDDDGERSEALRPQNTFNPILQRFYQNLQGRALDPTAALQDTPPVILKYLEPDSRLFRSTETVAALAEFEKVFETKLIPKKESKGRNRKQWNDLSDELDAMLNLGGAAPARSEKKEDDDDDGGGGEGADGGAVALDALIQVDEVQEIGTRDPMADFDKLLSQRSSADLFERLSASLWEVIYRLIDSSYGDLNFSKAVQCMLHLKGWAIKEEECQPFNAEITRFKAKYSEKKKALWEMVRAQKVTLISKSDLEDSAISDKEALEFLAETMEDTVQSEHVDIESDDDMDLV